MVASQVKDVMVENVDRVVERGEKLEALLERTEELEGRGCLTADGSTRSEGGGATVSNVWIVFIILIEIYLMVGIVGRMRNGGRVVNKGQAKAKVFLSVHNTSYPRGWPTQHLVVRPQTL